MPKVVGVRFHGTGKAYHFDPGSFTLHSGDAVIVETTQGIELGIVAEEAIEIPDEKLFAPLKTIIRVADTDDLIRFEENNQKEKEAFRVCSDKIASRGLDMRLVDVEYSFDSRKVIFYFTADGRVDFRELVKDLASIFHTRIELRQIGVRDEARMIGGLGICGRELCCCSYLTDFVPVSIKMAKVQNLSMNPVKISGNCGRLMCCLKYEQSAYEDAHSRMPRQGSIVMTDEGQGYIENVNLLKETVTVRLDRGGEADLITVPYESVSIIGGGRTGKRCPPGGCRPAPAAAAEAAQKPEREQVTAIQQPGVEQPDGALADLLADDLLTTADSEVRAKKRRSGRRGSGSRRRGRPGGKVQGKDAEG
jgi:cell fate regulator YaaT (PSP1 superfamily)